VAIRLIMEEGERRSAHIKTHGVNDWKLLPKNAALKPLVVIVDELTGLFALEAVPKAGKDAPQLLKDMADEANRTNLFKEILKNGIKRVAAELRSPASSDACHPGRPRRTPASTRRCAPTSTTSC
jgi:hypothetical protein